VAETVAPLRHASTVSVRSGRAITAKPCPADLYRDRGTVDHPPDCTVRLKVRSRSKRLASPTHRALDTSGLRARHASYTTPTARSAWLMLSTALALFLIDRSWWRMLGGGLAALLRRRAAPAVLAFAFIWPRSRPRRPAPRTVTTSPSRRCRRPGSLCRDGNADVDSIVKAGMSGLTLFWRSRGGHRAGGRRSVGIDPARDELRSPADHTGRSCRRRKAAADAIQQDRRPT